MCDIDLIYIYRTGVLRTYIKVSYFARDIIFEEPSKNCFVKIYTRSYDFRKKKNINIRGVLYFLV